MMQRRTTMARLTSKRAELVVSVSLTISIDAMGGDYGPQVTIPASLDCLKSNPNLKLILVGDEAIINPILLQQPLQHQDRLTVHHASPHSSSLTPSSLTPSRPIQSLSLPPFYLSQCTICHDAFTEPTRLPCGYPPVDQLHLTCYIRPVTFDQLYLTSYI